MRYFGFDPDGPPVKEMRRAWYSYRGTEEVEVTQEEKFNEFWNGWTEYRQPQQTVKQLVGECLKALGLRKGGVDARRELAIQQFPEWYSPPETPMKRPAFSL